MRAVDTAIKKYDEHSFRKVDCACVRMQRGDGGFFGCDAIYGWGSDPPPPPHPPTHHSSMSHAEPKSYSKWPLEQASETQPRSKWQHKPPLHWSSGARHGILFGRAVDTADIHMFRMQMVRTNE